MLTLGVVWWKGFTPLCTLFFSPLALPANQQQASGVGVNPSDRTAHPVKNVVSLSKRIPKEKSDERKSSQPRIEDDNRASEGLVEKSVRLRFAASIIWLEVGFHAGEMNMISVEKRPFCLHRLLKPHQQKQRLPNWSAFVDNWHWRMRC